MPPTALFDDNEVAECDEDPMFIDVIDTDLTAEFDEEDQHCEEFEHDITVNQLIAGIYSPFTNRRNFNREPLKSKRGLRVLL